ncbi:MAG: VCBS repeat-containing protein [Deltaproteobacteria bacterium]|nr:VCBS repeat-containing protein [Deltaproteobacteria bacterium]
MVADLGDVNDLSPGPDQGTLDASGDDVLDATDDLPMEGGVDVSIDRSEVFVPTADVWAGVLFVDLGGILIPVDFNAVPAPGSECVGDGGVRAGDSTIVPPRPVRPLSVSRVTSQRPTFQWILSEGTTGARVEVCADRCCTRVIQTLDAEGTTVRPTTALPPGVVFWRIFGRRAGVVGSRASYTGVRGAATGRAPRHELGTIRDFNGDGFDDLMMFRPQTPGEVLRTYCWCRDRRRVCTSRYRQELSQGESPGLGMVGDFNGDGLADVAWRESDRRRLPVQSWFETAVGSSGPMRSSAQPDFGMLGPCVELNSGSSVDWNGDGYSDIIVSVIFGCELALPPDASVLLGYYGSSSGFAVTPQWALRLDGRFAHRLVYVNAGVGDLNNDGYGDIFLWSAASAALGHHRFLPSMQFSLVPRPESHGSNECHNRRHLQGDGPMDVRLRSVTSTEMVASTCLFR